MARLDKTREDLEQEIGELREQLAESQETLRAIREGEVDALLVSTPEGEQVFTLQGADQVYRTIIEQMQEGAVMLVEGGRISYSNRRFAEMVKKPLQEIVGTKIYEHLIEPDRGGMQQLLHQVYEGAVRSELTIQARDGTLLPIHLSLSLMVLDGLPSICAIATDLTEHRWAEELERRVQERTAELSMANLKLEQARDLAQAADRAKSAFLHHMSHEMRTPLTAVIGMAELVLGDPLPPAHREYLAIVKDAGESLLTMVDDLLDLSRMETGSLALVPEVYDLPARLADTVRPLVIQAQKRGLPLSWQIEPDVPRMVLGDPHRLRQVLTNLLSNAIKFTRQGNVAVKVTQESVCGDGVMLHFAVSDTGIGIPEDRRSAIFTIFEQADNSYSRSHGGAGLGLTIAARLVNLMGGRIWVESECGRGSCFHFTAHFGLVPVHRTTAESTDASER